MTSAIPPSEPARSDFDARAATWDDDPAKVERAHAIAEAIVREAPLARSMDALEYGAGTGLVGFMLRPHFADVTLADLSDGMLAVAAKKIAAAGEAHMRAIKLDLLADPLPDRRYDIVFSAMTLHHIPDTRAILRRFREVLREPGLPLHRRSRHRGRRVPRRGIRRPSRIRPHRARRNGARRRVWVGALRHRV